MTKVEQLAKFVAEASYDMISESARQHLKVRILDSLGCAIGALGAEPRFFPRPGSLPGKPTGGFLCYMIFDRFVQQSRYMRSIEKHYPKSALRK